MAFIFAFIRVIRGKNTFAYFAGEKKKPAIARGLFTTVEDRRLNYSATAIDLSAFFSRLMPPIWTSDSPLIWFFSRTIWL